LESQFFLDDLIYFISFVSVKLKMYYMKKVIVFCGLLALLLTVSNCKKSEEATPGKCTPPSPPVATNNSPVAIGDTLKFTAASVSGATYSWTGPNGFKSSERNPSFIYSTQAKGEYLVTVTVDGCTSQAYHTYVITTDITATSSTEILTGGTLKLSATDLRDYGGSIIPTTYAWTGPNGFTSTLQAPSITSVTMDAAGTYSVTATASNGKKSNVATTTVIITPAATTISSNSTVNAPIAVGSTLTLTATAVTGATFCKWTGPNNFKDSTSLTPSISNISKAAEGTYSFYYMLNGVKSVVSTVEVGIKYSNSGCGGQTTVTSKGIIYHTVEISTQCWLKENLKNSSGADTLNWDDMNAGSSIDNQGACPTGWHLPDDDSWKTLAINVNGDGNQLKALGEGTGLGAGTNTTGFSVLLDLGAGSNKTATFWSTTEVSSTPRYMQLSSSTPVIYYSTANPSKKYHVRCLKD
jgi:uncharacterized protein (TIGR02145 family)